MYNTDPNNIQPPLDEEESEDSDMEEIITDDRRVDIAEEMEDVDISQYEADEESLDDSMEEQSDIEDDATSVFTFHKGCVFVVDVDKQNEELAVSGGEDDMAYVWNISTGEIVVKCTGHKDSVICACFNSTSTMVATGDMAGHIKVWDVKTKSCVWEFETEDLEWLQWHPVAKVLLAGTQDGQCWMWKIPSGDSKVFSSPGCSASCGKLLPDGKSVCVGYEDGTMKIFDMKTTQAAHSLKGRDGHSGQLTQISCHPTNKLVATSSLDGSVKLLNSTTGKVSNTFRCENKSQKTEDSEVRSIECVGFSSSLPLFAMGSLSGDLDIYDHKTNKLRHHCKHPSGVVQLAWDDGYFVYTACLDNVVRIWDARSGKLIRTYHGHSDHIYSISLSKKLQSLVTASADGTLRVFRLPEDDSPIR